MFHELRDHKEEFVIVQQFIYSHHVWMGSFFQYCQFVFHQLHKDIGLGHFVFSDYFDCAFDVGLPVHGNSDLTETNFTQNAADFIAVFDILDIFKTAKIFEGEDTLFIRHQIFLA